MTTNAQLVANKNNGLRSTGPKSIQGKIAAKGNALTHGLFAMSPVLPGEDSQRWLLFSEAIAKSLEPEGALEVTLVERIALIFWRMKRLMAYETAITSEKLNNLKQSAHQSSRLNYPSA